MIRYNLIFAIGINIWLTSCSNWGITSGAASYGNNPAQSAAGFSGAGPGGNPTPSAGNSQDAGSQPGNMSSGNSGSNQPTGSGRPATPSPVMPSPAPESPAPSMPVTPGAGAAPGGTVK